jgi:hypothetical protein
MQDMEGESTSNYYLKKEFGPTQDESFNETQQDEGREGP